MLENYKKILQQYYDLYRKTERLLQKTSYQGIRNIAEQELLILKKRIEELEIYILDEERKRG